MTLGERLREERERLGYTQPAFAAVVDAKKHAQINWEKGVAFPNAAALEAWAKVGLDVLYVLTGNRGSAPAIASLDAEEQLVLKYYKEATLPVRKAAMAVLLSGSSNLPFPRQPPSVKVSSKRGHAAGRDLIIGRGEEK